MVWARCHTDAQWCNQESWAVGGGGGVASENKQGVVTSKIKRGGGSLHFLAATAHERAQYIHNNYNYELNISPGVIVMAGGGGGWTREPPLATPLPMRKECVIKKTLDS